MKVIEYGNGSVLAINDDSLSIEDVENKINDIREQGIKRNKFKLYSKEYILCALYEAFENYKWYNQTHIFMKIDIDILDTKLINSALKEIGVSFWRRFWLNGHSLNRNTKKLYISTAKNNIKKFTTFYKKNRRYAKTLNFPYCESGYWLAYGNIE